MFKVDQHLKTTNHKSKQSRKMDPSKLKIFRRIDYSQIMEEKVMEKKVVLVWIRVKLWFGVIY